MLHGIMHAAHDVEVEWVGRVGLEVKLTGEVMADGRFEISGNNNTFTVNNELHYFIIY